MPDALTRGFVAPGRFDKALLKTLWQRPAIKCVPFAHQGDSSGGFTGVEKGGTPQLEFLHESSGQHSVITPETFQCDPWQPISAACTRVLGEPDFTGTLFQLFDKLCLQAAGRFFRQQL